MRSKDGYLIQKCLAGDAAAFGILVDKYKASIYALAHAKLRNFHDAEDVTQEVFIKAYEKLHTLRGWDNFYAWLYSITSNRCKMWLRSRGNRPDREYLEEQDEATVEKPSLKSHHEKMMGEMVGTALEDLPEIYRQVLNLYYLGGMNTREIAEFLRISPETIKSRLKRARLVLKEEMIAMMNTTFDEMRLQPAFTFRVVEAIKGTKIQTAPTKTALPFGVSVAAGLIALMLSLTVPQSPLYPIGQLIGSVLPSQMQVPEIGVIPVDTVEVTEITVLSGEKGKKDFGQKPKPRLNAFAPPGQEGKWTKKADMPTARYYVNTSVVNGKIYAIGGENGGSRNLSTVEEYDPTTNRWTKKADMPTGRRLSSSSVVNGKVYVIGGIRFNRPRLVPRVEEYDPKTDTWTKKADMPTARFALSTSIVNGKIYAIGGGNAANQPLSIVEEYDPVSDKWTKKADMPTRRFYFSASVVNKKIYAIGFAATVEEYDPKTDTWRKKSDVPTAREGNAGLSTSVVNGKIYVIGREPTVRAYNPATDKWTKKADMPTARSYLSTSAVNGRIYAIGGVAGGPALSSVEEYDTGFVPPQSVNPAGKLSTTWGEIKAAQ